MALVQIGKLTFRKEIEYMKTITSGSELENYILEEYGKHDVELSSLFFDVEVSMKQRDILETYQSIQYTINGDYIVRMENGRLPDR